MFQIINIFTCQKFCISPVQNRCKLRTTQPKIYPDAIEFLLSLRARCPSFLESKCTYDESSSIAIELTFCVALRRGFKKVDSVLSDIGDSWDSVYISLYLHNWAVLRLCIVFTIGDSPRVCSKYSH